MSGISVRAFVFSDSVNVAFSEPEGMIILSVSYQLAVDDYAYSVHIDSTGESRSHTFSLSQLGMTVSETSTINVAVGLEDNDGTMFLTKAVRLIAAENDKPSINNVEVAQRRDGSGIVDIWYDYNSHRSVSPATVSLTISDDWGDTFDVSVLSAGGDIGSDISVGQRRRITWRPWLDSPGSSDEFFVAKISLTDVEGNSTETTTGTIVVDAASPATPLVFMQKEDEKDKYCSYDGDDLKDRDLPVEVLESSSSSEG